MKGVEEMIIKEGDKVNVLTGKYKGQNVRITSIHVGFTPTGYSCTTRDNAEIFLFETEIQSMYTHDIKMLRSGNETQTIKTKDIHA